MVTEPSVSSLYQAVTIRQEGEVLAVGERTNANGSKKFRELLAAGDIDGMVAMAREQVKQESPVGRVRRVRWTRRDGRCFGRGPAIRHRRDRRW